MPHYITHKKKGGRFSGDLPTREHAEEGLRIYIDYLVSEGHGTREQLAREYRVAVSGH
ncbi:hypothetical protein GJ672_03555 [Spiribacter sp. 2438]|uniref:hypothetical protein n=1 Tax=Spiribacter sp. 2438 TaxID=2666185 RepID=UPI0012AF69A9|nr:hypothetical protein [Spiribacter sp. 2438]QGM21434.1 hypothetical protein GJ672_03555 [Spiribacter sp. 2438]